MTTLPVVAIGASAGGVEALSKVVSGLPADLDACVLVVLHIPPTGPSALGPILDRKGPLRARAARDGDPLEPRTILVAPPDRHLIVDVDTVRLSAGPRENGHRPAIDVLFRTAAWSHDAHVVAVVLSGLLDDGAAGAAAVRDRGGAVLVQDPADALYAAMPSTVISRIGPDAVASAAEMGALISKFCGSAPLRGDVSEDEMHDENNQSGRVLGPASGFICPDCNGSLYTVDDGALLRFRCRVGHAWGAENLVRQQGVSIEGALWVALRTLEEKAELSQRLADRAGAEGRLLTRAKFIESVAETLRSAETVKRLLDAGIGGSQRVSDLDAAPDVADSAGAPPVAS